ncbi:hypothetical protein QPL79_09065 [Ignisphaera sp. 4213-co]|uniref:Transmembrane protein n=1 Tax=Ignisphaera cupida TaxID=3050454 RepID=A0ABD4Z829_9CREN|nr:hypothetical protein [Ignisphaera sp. 4213-co]MDK6029512.1 hypothetical protein [Ignisphaera sp. 4213-co]
MVGDGCAECEVLLRLAKRCVDVYVKLCFDLEDNLMNYLFVNSVYGIPFLEMVELFMMLIWISLKVFV